MSRALARFEREAGAPLFDRVNRGFGSMSYGQIMLEHARRSIAEMRSAAERIAALRDPDTGRVRLAFLHSLASWYVPEQLRRFRETAPGIDFDLFQGPAHEITQRVLDGQIDIAITAPRPECARLRSGADCMSTDCVWPCRADIGSQAAPGCACRPRQASRSSHSAAQCGSATAHRPTLADDDVEPDIVFEATEIPTVEGLVAAGFGVAVVPVPRDGGRSEDRPRAA